MGLVKGSSSSRLNELRKYRIDGDLSDRYFTGGNLNNDGIDVPTSTADTIVNYYIGGIKYTDLYVEGEYDETIFEFTAEGTSSSDFINLPLIKDFGKGNVIGRPEVKRDVFIIRQSLSVFERQYRLKVITNLSELNFYAGGANFNIIDNI